jgi:hypothetical protein
MTATQTINQTKKHRGKNTVRFDSVMEMQYSDLSRNALYWLEKLVQWPNALALLQGDTALPQ